MLSILGKHLSMPFLSRSLFICILGSISFESLSQIDAETQEKIEQCRQESEDCRNLDSYVDDGRTCNQKLHSCMFRAGFGLAEEPIEVITVERQRIVHDYSHTLDGLSMSLGHNSDDFDQSGQESNSESGASEESKPKPKQKDSTTDCPVVIRSGTKVIQDTDFKGQNEFPLHITRHYNSNSYFGGSIFGANWNSMLDTKLRISYLPDTASCIAENGLGFPSSCTLSNDIPPQVITLYLQNGAKNFYPLIPSGGGTIEQKNTLVSSDGEQIKRIVTISNGSVSAVGGFTYNANNGTIYTFTKYGQVSKIENINGISWTFDYEHVSGADYLKSVTHSSGEQLTFTFNESGLAIKLPNRHNIIYADVLRDDYYTGTEQELAAEVFTSTVHFSSLANDTLEYTYKAKGLTEDTSIAGYLLTSISMGGEQWGDYQYYSDGKVSSSGLVNGINQKSFTYTSFSTSVTNTRGAVQTYTYDEKGQLEGVTHPSTSVCPAAARSYSTGADGRIKQEQNEDGSYTVYSYYDASGSEDYGNMKYKYEKGVTHEYIWDQYDRLTKVNIWDGAVESALCVDVSCPIPRSVPALVYDYVYDSSTAYRNRIRTIKSKALKYASNTYEPERYTTYSYLFHPNNLPSKITIDASSGAGAATTLEYDSQGRLTKTTDAEDNVSTFTYPNGYSNDNTFTDANGNKRDMTFDAKGRLKSIKRNDNDWSTTSYTYTAANEIKSVTYGNVTQLNNYYDTAQRLIGSIDSAGKSVSYSYDLLNNVETIQVGYGLTGCTSGICTPTQLSYYCSVLFSHHTFGQIVHHTIG
ncbi:DUF6531 domain-containing protein [Catenovulum sediminis]|uniref:DUF6531 domain-containing protein n=1 Tax=Catenovulum sediminis TaxID=1740262 RepID=A0ABV1RF61_9ALTE